MYRVIEKSVQDFINEDIEIRQLLCNTFLKYFVQYFIILKKSKIQFQLRFW